MWAPTQIDFYVDGAVQHTVKGTTSSIPYTAGYEALILRPKDTTFISDAFYRVQWASYDPAYAPYEPTVQA